MIHNSFTVIYMFFPHAPFLGQEECSLLKEEGKKLHSFKIKLVLIAAKTNANLPI